MHFNRYLCMLKNNKWTRSIHLWRTHICVTYTHIHLEHKKQFMLMVSLHWEKTVQENCNVVYFNFTK